MNHRYRSQILCATILAAGGLAGSAAAQSAVDEVVITARNRVESVQNVPLSINAITSGQIERSKVETFEDVTRLTPSLVFDKGFSIQDTRPVIRGLPSSRGRPPVGVLVDGVDTSSEAFGVSAGGSSLLNLRAIDVERIEVVKGPQSALYGRVAFGGAINYITKKPSDTFGSNSAVRPGSMTPTRSAAPSPVRSAINSPSASTPITPKATATSATR